MRTFKERILISLSNIDRLIIDSDILSYSGYRNHLDYRGRIIMKGLIDKGYVYLKVSVARVIYKDNIEVLHYIDNMHGNTGVFIKDLE